MIAELQWEHPEREATAWALPQQGVFEVVTSTRFMQTANGQID